MNTLLATRNMRAACCIHVFKFSNWLNRNDCQLLFYQKL